MNKSFNLQLILFALALSACAPKNESGTDVRAAADAGQLDVHRAKATVKVALDGLAKGGQPGTISLGGQLSHGGRVDPKIHVEFFTGHGTNGSTPELAKDRLQLSETTVAEKSSGQSQISGEFLNLGCDESELHASGMSRFQMDQTQQLQLIRVNTVYVCGNQNYKGSMIFVDAETLVVESGSIHISGTVTSSLSFNVRKLVLEGDSEIVSKAEDSGLTVIGGPSLALSAAEVEGDGSLTLRALGSNALGNEK